MSSSDASPSTVREISAQFTPAKRYYVLAVLTCGYVLNFVDRQVMTILLEPIKAEFGASDTQMGLISGLAFALFYATLGVPVARLADRWSRRNVLSISMATWSAVTAACGMAASFWQLALLRVGVGVGEAGGTPPSQSLLTDYFPPEQRTFAQGILATAPNIGILVGLFGGALIAEAYGWRTVFIAFGIPGIFLAVLLYFTVAEPVKPKPTIADNDNLWQSMKRIASIPSFMFIALGVGFAAIPGYGIGVWSPSLLVRVHGMTLVEAGMWLGIIGIIGGSFGNIFSGWLVDKLARRDKRWQLWIPALGLIIAIPLQALFVMWPESSTFQLAGTTLPTALIFMGLAAIVAVFWVAPSYAAVQNLVPDHLRTQASAVLLLVFNLLGLGLGPLSVGMLSDAFSAFGVYSVRWALLITLSLGFVAAFCYTKAASRYRDTVEI